ncbi:MAG: helix-turn-helix domain-containing protein [Candidatus Omnitrophota bacterium]
MKKMLESYTADEVALALKLHPYTVRRLCREGKIPSFKAGGSGGLMLKKLNYGKKETTQKYKADWDKSLAC